MAPLRRCIHRYRKFTDPEDFGGVSGWCQINDPQAGPSGHKFRLITVGVKLNPGGRSCVNCGVPQVAT